jgi:hypothetical protein
MSFGMSSEARRCVKSTTPELVKNVRQKMRWGLAANILIAEAFNEH